MNINCMCVYIYTYIYIYIYMNQKLERLNAQFTLAPRYINYL